MIALRSTAQLLTTCVTSDESVPHSQAVFVSEKWGHWYSLCMRHRMPCDLNTTLTGYVDMWILNTCERLPWSIFSQFIFKKIIVFIFGCAESLLLLRLFTSCEWDLLSSWGVWASPCSRTRIISLESGKKLALQLESSVWSQLLNRLSHVLVKKMNSGVRLPELEL